MQSDVILLAPFVAFRACCVTKPKGSPFACSSFFGKIQEIRVGFFWIVFNVCFWFVAILTAVLFWHFSIRLWNTIGWDIEQVKKLFGTKIDFIVSLSVTVRDRNSTKCVRETYVRILIAFNLLKGTFYTAYSYNFVIVFFHSISLIFWTLTSSCYSSNVNFLWGTFIKLRSNLFFSSKHSILMAISFDIWHKRNERSKHKKIFTDVFFVIILGIFFRFDAWLQNKPFSRTNKNRI